MMDRYKCRICGWVIEVEANKVLLYPFVPSSKRVFPTHTDCELAKPLSQIDFDKLEKLL